MNLLRFLISKSFFKHLAGKRDSSTFPSKDSQSLKRRRLETETDQATVDKNHNVKTNEDKLL